MTKEIKKQPQVWKNNLYFTKGKDSASLLELFFDLAVLSLIGGLISKIISIYQPSKHLHTGIIFTGNHPSVDVILLILEISITLLIWRNVTFYANRYESEDARHRIIMFFFIIPLVLSAASTYLPKEELQNSLILNGIGQALAFLSLWFAHFRLYLHASNKYIKEHLLMDWIGHLTTFLIGLSAMIFIYYFSNNPTGIHVVIYILLLSLMIINISIFNFAAGTMKVFVNLPTQNVEHIRERYSILFIIFLGEVLYQIISSFAENTARNFGASIAILLLGTLLIFSWWWIYHDLFNFNDLIYKPFRIRMYSFLMLLFFISIVIITTGMSLLIEDPKNKPGTYFLLAGVILYSVSGAISSFCFEKYNKSSNYIKQRWLEWVIYMGPFINATLIGFSFAIDGLWVLVIVFCLSIILCILLSIASIENRRHAEESNKKILTEIERREKIDVIWRKKQWNKYGDEQLHKSFNYELNQFSIFGKHSSIAKVIEIEENKKG